MVKFYRRWLTTLLLVAVTGLTVALTIPAWGKSQPPAPVRPILYDFGSGRCYSCQQMEKILQAVKNRYGSQVDIRLIYVEKDQDLARQYKVMLIPTQVFVDASGKEVFRHMGLFPQAELVKKLQELKFVTQ
jgi:thioredoxin 1